MGIGELLRWLVRRDADSNGTLFGGWIQDIGTILAVVIGVSNGALSGILFYAGMKILKVVVGWYDLRIGATKYRNHYISSKVPMNVRLIRTKKRAGTLQNRT